MFRLILFIVDIGWWILVAIYWNISQDLRIILVLMGILFLSPVLISTHQRHHR